VPAVVDVVGAIPVVAAGGIGDGRGLAAVLLLGAEGAWIGTRFVASWEAASAEWAKQRVVAATADDTVLTRAYDLATAAPFPPEIRDRVVRNAFTAEWAGRDDEVVARRTEVRAQLARAEETGDTRIAAVRAGTVAGLIGAVEPAGEIVRRIAAEAEQLLRERPRQLLR
jgi:nitronate monooxygenase